MSFLTRMENRFGRLAIPGLLKILAIFQALVWLLVQVANPQYTTLLTLDPDRVLAGEVWRLFTFAFIPRTNSVLWIVVVTFFLMWLSNGLDQAWGAFRVNVYFAVTMLGLIIAAFLTPGHFRGGIGPESALLYSAFFLAFATLYPNEQILLFFIIPVKVKWLGWLAAVFLVLMVAARPGLVWAVLLSHAGYLAFFGPAWLRERRQHERVTTRRKEFTSKQIDHSEPFHRCHGCGATDQAEPQLDFRVAADEQEYCSRCLAGGVQAGH